MMTKQSIEKLLTANELVIARLRVLRLAEEINPQFKKPHIVGGFLRNIILGAAPRDCDVVFQGTSLHQEGIIEAIEEAEDQLGIPHYNDWDFENTSATGFSGNFYEDNIGKYSYHTDHLTMIMMDTQGAIYLGKEEQTLINLQNRIYDLHFPGVYIWAIHRGQGRSFFSCLAGDLVRAFYLCSLLGLEPSSVTAFFMEQFDAILQSLDSEDQEKRIAFWYKKTDGASKYQAILDRYGVTSLKTSLNES